MDVGGKVGKPKIMSGLGKLGPRGEAQLEQGGEFRLRHEPGTAHSLDTHMAWGWMSVDLS